MTGCPVRVAVQFGSAAVRVAGVDAGGEPWLVAHLPPCGQAGAPAVAAMLTELIGPPTDEPGLEELVLVHPGRLTRSAVACWVAEYAGLAPRVRAVPAPRAAAGAAAGAGVAGLVVLDVGHYGAECAWLGPDGAVRAWRAVDAGGRRLDELVAARFAGSGATTAAEEARRLREALSLLPSGLPLRSGGHLTGADLRPVLAPVLGAVVNAVRDLLAVSGPAPVLLVGGVARTPLLAELLDEAGIPDVTVAPRLDAAAVLGALALPPDVGVVAPDPTGLPVAALPGPPRTSHRTDTDGVTADRPRWLGSAAPARSRSRAVPAVLGCAGVAAALLVAGGLVAAPGEPPGAAPVPAAGVLVQYGYRFDLPAGWEHTGGLAERRRVLLTPAAAPEGSDLIAVERTPLGYDSDAERQRARAELLAEFEAAVAAGSRLSGYDADARVAGRSGAAYRQADPDGTVVDWFVLLDGDAQLSVGCRYTGANADAVRTACDRVVASVGTA